ncbi:MAG: hypothetical protein Q8P00_06760 [Dehalococcoidia bacterium]|nr:hypothetical protein [Dehalococcoidia bacterium]
MAKVVRLFRSPDTADKALGLLRDKGFNNEVSVVFRPMEQNRGLAAKLAGPSKSAIGGLGELLSTGPISTPLKENKEELAALLIKELGISAEQGKYYEFALRIGGILVAVYADESKTSLARQALKSAETLWKEPAVSAKSPGFVKAGRMVDTNPVDAPMSGDFRRY